MRFAENTVVSVEQTKADIEATVDRYGATGFLAGWLGDRAMVSFEMRDRRVRFFLPLPARDDRQFTVAVVRRRDRRRTPKDEPRTPEQAKRLWEKACRQRWRALLLIVKAKLEAVESEITTFDEEFLSHIVMPDGMTIAERIVPELTKVLEGASLPKLLGN